MSYLIYGAVGTLAVLGLLACGVFIGWKANNAFQKYTRRRAEEEATEEQKRRERAQQAFFEGMLSYNVETAYNIAGGAELE